MKEKTKKLPRDTWLTADHLWISSDGTIKSAAATRVRLCLTSSGIIYMLGNTDGSQRKYSWVDKVIGSEQIARTAEGDECIVLHLASLGKAGAGARRAGLMSAPGGLREEREDRESQEVVDRFQGREDCRESRLTPLPPSRTMADHPGQLHHGRPGGARAGTSLELGGGLQEYPRGYSGRDRGYSGRDRGLGSTTGRGEGVRQGGPPRSTPQEPPGPPAREQGQRVVEAGGRAAGSILALPWSASGSPADPGRGWRCVSVSARDGVPRGYSEGRARGRDPGPCWSTGWGSKLHSERIGKRRRPPTYFPSRAGASRLPSPWRGGSPPIVPRTDPRAPRTSSPRRLSE